MGMRSTTDISRKSLLIGSAWGLLALTAGCAKSATGSEVLPSSAPSTNAIPAWSYEGAEGPSDWGNLSPAFQTCSTGKAQSPIDIDFSNPGSATSMAPLKLAYTPSECEVQDNGHTLELHTTAPQQLTVGETSYAFKQMHFHDPSEHTVQGTRFDVEFHFVHQSDDGVLAVVGLLAKSGTSNAAWAPFVDAAHAAASGGPRSIGAVDLASLLPGSLDHYAYEGSLTTPPCTENVKWLVLETPIELSPAQIKQLQDAHSGNNRPTQQLNSRGVSVVDQ